jgi:hypothetical protein
MEIEKLKYPIGRFEYGKKYSMPETNKAIAEIAELPPKLKQLTALLLGDRLRRSYRPGAWTATQLINHLGDVYINAYMRTKWLLTEDNPTIKTYDENGCALLPDSHYNALDVSIKLIDNIIERWVYLLSNISSDDFKRQLYHPEYQVSIQLDELIVAYRWHGYHHLAHLEIIVNETDLT